MTIVIGGGLIAKKFKSVTLPLDCVVIASGVSNSQETRIAEFQREMDLVSKVLLENPCARVIYFSTCSVYQKELTAYVRHKLVIEEFIRESSDSYHILRLPQVVGCVNNSTLISYLTRSIFEGRCIRIQKHAARNLLDVNDVVRLAQHLINNDVGRDSVCDLASAHNVLVLDIALEISKILNVSPDFELSDSGESYEISTSFMRDVFGCADEVLLPDYWKTVLLKYVPMLIV